MVDDHQNNQSAQKRHDPIDYPEHYAQGNIEVLRFILDQRLDFCLGCVVKYICRHEMKGGVEDLKKAKAYLDRAIDQYDWLYKKEVNE